MDILKSMQLFTKVVELNSFSAAAVELDIAHSTISKNINNLEDSLNVQLISRTARRVQPTDAGIQFYKSCTKIIHGVDTAWGAISKTNNQLTKNIHLSIPASFSRYATKIASSAKACIPGIRIEICPSNTSVDLMKSGYNLSIREGEPEDGTHVAQHLFTSQMTLCASPEYINNFGTPQTLADLKTNSCLTYQSGKDSNTWNFINKFTGETVTQVIKGAFRANNCDLLSQVALLGEGITYIPSYVAAPYIKDGKLVNLSLKGLLGTKLPVYAVHPSGKSRARKIHAFVDILKAVFAELDVNQSIKNAKSQTFPLLKQQC